MHELTLLWLEDMHTGKSVLRHNVETIYNVTPQSSGKLL